MPFSLRRPQALAVVGLSAVLALSACGSDSGGASAEGGLTPVNMAFEWTCEGTWAPIYSGLEQGIFEKNGIDLSYDRGQGGSDTVPLVATGEFDLAELSAPPVIIGAGEELPLTVIGAASTVGPVTILADDSITEPKDLEGHSLAVQTDQFEGGVWDAFVKATGIDVSKVDVIPSDDATTTEFLDGKIDAMVIFYNTASTKEILDTLPDLTVMPMQEYVPTYGHTIVANNQWLSDNDTAAKGFMTAFAESTKWVVDNRDAALATLQENCAEVDADALEFSLDAYIENWKASTAGYGSFTEDGLTQTQKVLVDAGLATQVPVSDFSTQDYQPDSPVLP
ncbi:ABC transporter substrate-binding protein [Kineosporia sp. J2-2]|uniref:ABC transporter substrate-binding protein n=1 Tax=Kineosporia corallincola TaxID=2835133 RepID=A0ABS5TDM1_9ACTN|nr:ABC transporter substrate-binding protein [Kineosporia corallincola]MBT0768509.1 ABC transporter substrate-binding protein [Kineosporia corallincola]